MGFRSPVRRSTLAEANESRDWRIYAELAQWLMVQARKLCAQESLGVDLAAAAYALDSPTIDLCLSLFPWAHFRSTKSAVTGVRGGRSSPLGWITGVPGGRSSPMGWIKMHTLLGLRGSNPVFILVTTGDTHDVTGCSRIVALCGPLWRHPLENSQRRALASPGLGTSRCRR
jgi:hypothetical protein